MKRRLSWAGAEHLVSEFEHGGLRRKEFCATVGDGRCSWMLGLVAATRIFAATSATDMRPGFNGLYALAVANSSKILRLVICFNAPSIGPIPIEAARRIRIMHPFHLPRGKQVDLVEHPCIFAESFGCFHDDDGYLREIPKIL